jgi:anti-anti-sigma factor
MAKIEKNTFEKGYIIYLEGQFTGGNETDDLVAMVKEIKEEKNKNLIVDFKNATYLSSIVIGLLVRTKADFQKIGLSVVYSSFNKTLEDVLKMTKVWSIIEIAEDVESAKKMIH